MFPLVYEINTRIWLKKLSEKHNQPITLGNVPDEEFTLFSACGFDMVWLMGVWRTSQYSKAIASSHSGLRSSFLEHIATLQPGDIASSPYSIPSYSVNEALGGEAELVVFRQKLKSFGIRLMLDFVPNHLALDNEWLPEHPEYFVPVSTEERALNPDFFFEYAPKKYLACGKDPYFDPWSDTLQLNYARPETHEMMTENLFRISSLCDAVRCDVAMLIIKDVFNSTWPNLEKPMESEFWRGAIAAVKEHHPDFLFLAESYWDKEWELQQQGFDFTYDKPFYDALCSRPVNGATLTRHLEAQSDYQKHLCRFIENHDEERAAEKTGPNNRAAALVLLTAPGMHLVYQDQMEGFRLKLPVQLVSQSPETVDHELVTLYKKLFSLQKKSLFQEGEVGLLKLNSGGNPECFGFRRYTETEQAFVLANFSETGAIMEFRHQLPEPLSLNQLQVFSTIGKRASEEITGELSLLRIHLAPHEGVVISC